jgi:transcriptional regulator with XRE-family HTH domain
MTSFKESGCLDAGRSYDEVLVMKKMVRIRKALGIKRCEFARILGVRLHLLTHIELRFRGGSLCYFLMLRFYRSIGVDLNLLFDDSEYPEDGLKRIKSGAELKKVLRDVRAR